MGGGRATLDDANRARTDRSEPLAGGPEERELGASQRPAVWSVARDHGFSERDIHRAGRRGSAP